MRYTANFSLKEPQKNIDLADVEDLNDNFEDIDEIMHNAQISIADAYDSTATYDVDDVVMYEGLLYKCITAITVAEAWDSTKWERTTAATSGGGGNANVTEITYSQYSALTPTEKANGTIYCVTNDPNDSAGGGGGGGISYSTTEQDTGLTWIDGKHIYQRTLNPNITLTTTGQSVMTMADIDTIVDVKPLLVKGGNQCQSPYSPSDAFVAWQLISGVLLFYITGQHYNDAVLKYVTVQYTKTS